MFLFTFYFRTGEGQSFKIYISYIFGLHNNDFYNKKLLAHSLSLSYYVINWLAISLASPSRLRQDDSDDNDNNSDGDFDVEKEEEENQNTLGI